MIRIFLFGSVFGFILSRVGATDYDAIANMFLLRDLHLMGVIGVAVVVAGLGLALFHRLGLKARDGAPLRMTGKPDKPGLVVGSVLFGAGWALTGTCPGTALAQVGELKLIALFTVMGIVLGTTLYRRVGGRLEAWLEDPRARWRPVAWARAPGSSRRRR